jgi:hypothetical protein
MRLGARLAVECWSVTFTYRMRHFGRSINRDLWPRRYTAWFIAIVVGTFAGFQAFQVLSSRPTNGFRQWMWLLFLGAVAISSLVEATTGTFSKLRRKRYERRRTGGLCGKCGYDLRGATSVNCPECGAWHGTTPGKRFDHSASEG